MTPLYCFFFVLLSPVVGEKTHDITENLHRKDVSDMVSHIKAIPQTEIIALHALPVGDKGVSVEKMVDQPHIMEIKPIAQPVLIQPTMLNTVSKKKNKYKLKNRRSKLAKKQNKNLRMKNKLRQKPFRKQLLNRKKQWLRKNRLRNKSKKQMRNLKPGKFSKVIDLIISHHEKGKASKLSTDYIEQQVLNLLKGQRSAKNCPKPKSKQKKSRKRLRSFNRINSSKKGPIKKAIVSKGTQRIFGGTGRGKTITNAIEKVLKNGRGRSKANKGKVKSKVTVRFGHKKKPRKLHKTNKKNKSKKF